MRCSGACAAGSSTHGGRSARTASLSFGPSSAWARTRSWSGARPSSPTSRARTTASRSCSKGSRSAFRRRPRSGARGVLRERGAVPDLRPPGRARPRGSARPRAPPRARGIPPHHGLSTRCCDDAAASSAPGLRRPARQEVGLVHERGDDVHLVHRPARGLEPGTRDPGFDARRAEEGEIADPDEPRRLPDRLLRRLHRERVGCSARGSGRGRLSRRSCAASRPSTSSGATRP